MIKRVKENSVEVNVKLAKTVFLFQFSQAETGTCKYDEYSIKSESGNLTCLACHKCRAGFGLFPQCGIEIKGNETRNECKPCILGKTYSEDEDISSCKPCGSCADHQTIVKNCTLDSASQCKDMPFYKQCDVNTAKNCKPKCQNDQYVVPGSKGGGHCQDCKACPPGKSPFPECGSVVENVNNTLCRVCIKGQTFSDNCGKSPCKHCTRCSSRQREILPCSLERDRVCSYCRKGFYRDDNSNECKRHSNFIGWLAGALAGGVVVIIFAVIYLWWKFCRKPVTIVHGLDGSNPFLISMKKKVRIVHQLINYPAIPKFCRKIVFLTQGNWKQCLYKVLEDKQRVLSYF